MEIFKMKFNETRPLATVVNACQALHSGMAEFAEETVAELSHSFSYWSFLWIDNFI